MSPAELHRADFTRYSAVILCLRPACAWRCLAHSPASAWRLYADHCRRVHHDVECAGYARRRAQNGANVS